MVQAFRLGSASMVFRSRRVSRLLDGDVLEEVLPLPAVGAVERVRCSAFGCAENCAEDGKSVLLAARKIVAFLVVVQRVTPVCPILVVHLPPFLPFRALPPIMITTCFLSGTSQIVTSAVSHKLCVLGSNTTYSFRRCMRIH